MGGSLRRSLASIAHRAALLCAVALAWGCPAPGYDPDAPSRTAVDRVLVLPLNVVAAMPRELAGSARRVEQSLLDYLAARGKSVQTIGFRAAVDAWRAGESACRSVETKGCGRFVGVAPYAARQLRASHDYDVLIVPYLLLRAARTDGGMASFDGVRRPVEISQPDGPYHLGGGRIRAASLKVYGFAPDGERTFAGIGGLDVVDRIEGSDEGAYTIEVRESVLSDPDAIREGVARALSNFVPGERD